MGEFGLYPTTVAWNKKQSLCIFWNVLLNIIQSHNIRLYVTFYVWYFVSNKLWEFLPVWLLNVCKIFKKLKLNDPEDIYGPCVCYSGLPGKTVGRFLYGSLDEKSFMCNMVFFMISLSGLEHDGASVFMESNQVQNLLQRKLFTNTDYLN